MIVKVNRVNSDFEYKLLQNLKVDIIGFSINRLSKEQEVNQYDSRSLSVEEVISIIKSTERKTKISVHIHQTTNLLDIIKYAIKEIEPDYLNYYVSFHLKTEQLTKEEKEYLNAYNAINGIPSIIFGNGVGYDTPILFDKAAINSIKHVEYIEMSFDTVNTQSEFYIQSGEDDGLKQANTSDTLLESILEYTEVLPILIDDKINEETIVNDVKRVKAKGVTLSLSGSNKDFSESKNENYYLSEITENYYSIEELEKLVRRIKNL